MQTVGEKKAAEGQLSCNLGHFGEAVKCGHG